MSTDKREALAALIRAYVNLLETGRDRIIAAGGDCDSVENMERSDPHLRAARAALATQPAQPEPSAQGEAVAWLVEWKAHGHEPRWWGFNHTPGKNATWCSDANNAIRFARKEDAERMRLHHIAVAGLTGMHSYERSVSVTEHMWTDAVSKAAAQPSAQGEATQAENAARYLYIREQHWSTSDICCVTKPKTNVLLGSYCPHGELLDAFIDERRKK